MSIFKHWEKAKWSESEASAAIRTAAKQAVESGKITLEEAIKAAEAIVHFDQQRPEIKARSINIFRGLFDRAGVTRQGFKHDKNNLCEADAIFADELKELVHRFNAQKTLSDMSKEQLTSKADELAIELNKFVDELNRRFPVAAAAATTSEPDMAEVDAKSARDWERNLGDCQSTYPSFTAYQARKRYDAKNPNMA